MNYKLITVSPLRIALIFTLIAACSADHHQETNHDHSMAFTIKEVIDLGALVTEDLPERVWGKAFMEQMKFEKNNEFDIREWEYQGDNGMVTGSNAYYTLFNHGGPHIDAPNHMDIGEGLDGIPISTFVGPLKVFDVSDYPIARSVPKEVFEKAVSPGDIVLIYTGYQLPQSDDEIPGTVAITFEAAEYLAQLPVRAFGTDGFNVECMVDTTKVQSDSEIAGVAPNHYAFLSRGIPLYEQLFNVDQLLGKENMTFVGVPLNIKDGDGMMVRPVVLVH